MDNLQQMREAFQKTYGGLGLMSEIEAALLGAWCLAWTAGAEAAQEDAIGLACVTGIVNDMAEETRDDFRDNFLRSWVDLVDRKGFWSDSEDYWREVPSFSDLAAQTHDGLPCIVRLNGNRYLRGVSYPDGTTIPANEPFPPEKTCYRWFIPDYGQFKDCQQSGESKPQDVSEIPVSERLPKTDRFVLARVAPSTVFHVASWRGEHWLVPSPNGTESQRWTCITHWKPL